MLMIINKSIFNHCYNCSAIEKVSLPTPVIGFNLGHMDHWLSIFMITLKVYSLSLTVYAMS